MKKLYCKIINKDFDVDYNIYEDRFFFNYDSLHEEVLFFTHIIRPKIRKTVIRRTVIRNSEKIITEAYWQRLQTDEVL